MRSIFLNSMQNKLFNYILLTLFINNFLIARQDTTKIQLDSITTTVRDTIVLRNDLPFGGGKNLYTSELINYDYRNTNDFFRMKIPSFKLGCSFSGYKTDLFLFGIIPQHISYFENGIMINDPIYQGYDLLFQQSDWIDSIELLPSSRAMLYGYLSNPAAINLITKNIIPPLPYSRIKYIEGPSGEGNIDAQFSTFIYDRIVASFDVTNTKDDDGYTNTDFSLWQARTNFSYLFTNGSKLSFNYSYSDIKLGLNGGVAFDSLTGSPAEIEDDFYNNISAPVLFSKRYVKSKRSDYTLSYNGTVFNSSDFDFKLYHQTQLTEFRQNENQINQVKFDNSFTANGISFRNEYKYLLGKIQFGIFYDERIVEDENLVLDLKRKSSSVYAILSFPFLNASEFSVFGKYLVVDNVKYIGGGIDLNFKKDKVFVYAGTSIYKCPNSSILNNSTTNGSLFSIEAMIGFNLDFINLDFSVRNLNNTSSTDEVMLNSDLSKPNYFYGLKIESHFNAGINSKINLKPFYLLANYSYTNSKYYGINFNVIPENVLSAGVYYNEMHFDSSLNLNTGFRVDFNSSFYSKNNDPFLKYNQSDYKKIGSHFTINFELSGRIKESATVYFIWENLLDRKYYLIPYYPMQRRGLRFGLAWELFN